MLSIEIEDFQLNDVFTCGQCFRWQAIAENKWIGIAGGEVLCVSQNGKTVYFDCSQEAFERHWRHYFDLDRHYDEIKKTLIKGSPDLAEAIAFGSGIRLLNQEPFEMLITFILSANNHIPRITELVRRLCTAYGERVPHQWESIIGPLHAFPKPEVLAEVPIETLRSLGTGYRDVYIHESAVKAASEFSSFEAIGDLPYEAAKAKLMTFSGVGPKVADCILLFSSGKHEAFPIDTWIKKTLARRYGVPENKPKQIQNFIEANFGVYKGFANQYLFYYERSLQNEHLIK